MTKKFNAKYYEKVKNDVKNMFRVQKFGSQQFDLNQSKLFKPITESTNEVSRAVQDKIVSDKENFNNILVPMITELVRSNDQREELQQLPYYSTEVPEPQPVKASTPKRSEIKADLDKEFNETDRENLQGLSLPLPSMVYQLGTIDATLKQIETNNRKIGQYLRADSKRSEVEKKVYESQKDTLVKYRQRLILLKDSEIIKIGQGLKAKKIKQKQKRGRPKSSKNIIYKDGDDLAQKLGEYVAAYEAGNNGVEETIQDILDELLNIKAISKSEYDQIYKNLFIKI